ncbi:MAG: helix-turn-helix transcriptional regulator [Elusimicrobiaceae bacterium]|nr:helix-turn-helix transcriptional regulator [Elusimicrobiaceae bacterium]
MKQKSLPPCPVAVALQVIGNKWKILIIRDLLTGTKRFGFLKKSVGCSQKVLTENLRALEQDGIVVRQVYAEVPPRVEYSLSALGKTMRPVLRSMAAWGEKYRQSFSVISV